MIRNVLTALLFLLSLGSMAQSPQLTTRFGIEPSLNYSFLENKSFSKDLPEGTYKSYPNIGIGLNLVWQFKLFEKHAFIAGWGVNITSFRHEFDELSFLTDHFSLINVPLHYQYNISPNYAVEIGTDITYGFSPDASSIFYVDSSQTAIRSKVTTKGYSQWLIPITVGVNRNFLSKKGRHSALTLSFKKSFQTISEHTLETYLIDEEGNNRLASLSKFKFNNTYISLGYRIFLGRVIIPEGRPIRE